MVFDFAQLQPFWQILLAAFLGALIGLEREYKRKEAGLRTFALVAVGTCFFTVISGYFAFRGDGESFLAVDPTRVIQAVAVGIGFIGSGLIIRRKAQIEGLTTAAALWATSAIGIGVGLELYLLSILGTLLIIAILAALQFVEEKLFGKKDKL